MKKMTLWMITSLLCAPMLAAPTVEGLYFDQAIQGSYNPMGLQSVTQLYYRSPLVRKPGILWESTKFDVGFQNNLSPAYDLVGVFAKVEPVAFFDLQLLAQAGGYFKLFGYGFFDMASYNSPFGSNDLRTGSRDAFGYNLSASPTLKFVLGPMAALNAFSLNYFYVDSGEGFFLERTGGAILAKSDYHITNQAYLLFTLFEGFRLGLNDGIMYVPSSGYLSHRVSAGAIYTHKLSDKLDIYSALLAGTFLSDAYNQGKLFIGTQVGITLRLV